MRVLLLGRTGSVGSGIAEILALHPEFELFNPSSYELNLKNGSEVKKYLSRLMPEAIIHAAGKTANEATPKVEELEIAKSNIESTSNLISAVTEIGDGLFIHIGSAGIYQNLNAKEIDEENFRLISASPPTQPYSQSKYEESLRILEANHNSNRWSTIILPYILADAKNANREFGNLFNRVSTQFVNSLPAEFHSSIDFNRGRQVVCARNVGLLCIELINERISNGLLHYPGKEIFDLNYFVSLHRFLARNSEIPTNQRKYLDAPESVLRTSRKDMEKFRGGYSVEQFVRESLIRNSR